MLSNRGPVRREEALGAGERANEGHQRRSRLVKVGEQAIHDPPAMPWLDEQASLTRRRSCSARILRVRRALQCSGARRSDGDDGCTSISCPLDGRSGSGRQLEMLCVHRVLIEIGRLNRQKGAEPDVQSQARQFAAPGLQSLE